MSDAICLISGLGVEVDGATIELRIHHTDSGAHAMMHATYISRRRDRRRRQRQPERDIAHVVAASHFCSGVEASPVCIGIDTASTAAPATGRSGPAESNADETVAPVDDAPDVTTALDASSTGQNSDDDAQVAALEGGEELRALIVCCNLGSSVRHAHQGGAVRHCAQRSGMRCGGRGQPRACTSSTTYSSTPCPRSSEHRGSLR